MRCKVIATRTRERMFGCHFSMCLSSIFVSRARFQQNCVNVCNVFRADSVIGVAYGIESIEWMNAWMNVKFKTKWEKHNLKKEIEPKYQQVSEQTPYSEWMEHKSAMIETLKWSLKWLPIVFASGCLYDMETIWTLFYANVCRLFTEHFDFGCCHSRALLCRRYGGRVL